MTARSNWLVVLICASAVLSISMGVRQVSGLFLRPVVTELALSRETFGLVVGLQNLVWGLAQPIAGYLADRYGARSVAFVSGLVYALGMAIAASANSAPAFALGFGVLAGLGQAGTAFAVTLAAIGRAAPEAARSMALGIGSAAGSIGMFLLVPFTSALIGEFDWRVALAVLVVLLAVTPALALPLERRSEAGQKGADDVRAALRSVAGERDFWLINFGFAVCGFQLAFVATYLPTILVDAGMSLALGAGVLATIGACNILGSYLAGVAGGRHLKSRVLAATYVARAAVMLAFVLLPPSPASAILFGVTIGLLWTGTVPLTSGLVADLWGRRHLALIFALVYVGHQLGAFLGAWAGGFAFDRTGSLAGIWALSIGASLFAAACHLSLVERPRPLALAESARA